MRKKKITTVFFATLLICAGLLCLLGAPLTAKADPVPPWDFEDHTVDHADLTSLTQNQIVYELTTMNSVFQAHNLPPPLHLAYPNGAFNAEVVSVVSQYRLSARTTGGFGSEHYPVPNWYTMSAACMQADIGFNELKALIDNVVAQKTLLNLFTHQVTNPPAMYGTTPQILGQVLDYLVTQQDAGNLEVLTMRQAYTEFNGQNAVVVISFDDGWVTDYTVAWPMFAARGLAGTSYIVSDIVDANDPMRLNWNMVAQMANVPPPTGWSVSISSSPSAGGSTTPAGVVSVESGPLTVTANPASGYTFTNWLFDDAPLTSNPVTLPAQGGGTSHSLTANFVQTSSSAIFQDGFESGTFSNWWWTDGALSVVSSPTHSGSYAARAVGGYSYWDKLLASSYSDLFFAGYVQFPSALSNDQATYFMDVYDAAYSNVVAGGMYVDGGSSYWLLNVNGDWFLSSPTSIQPNHWYFMEIEYKTDGTAKLWIDDTLVAFTSGQTLPNNAQHVQAGNPSGATPAGFTSFGDDFTVAAGYISSGSQPPPPPPTYSLTVNALDNFGSAVTAAISIDGNPVGATGGTFSVLSGPHTLQVSVPSGCTFQDFTYNGNTDPNNPATLSVTSTMTVTANYLRTTSALFQDGFEGGNFDAWSGTATSSGGALQVVSSPVHDGQHAAHATTSAAGQNANTYYSLSSALPTVDMSLYVNYATYNSGTQPVLVMYQTSGGENIAYLRISYYGSGFAVLQIANYANGQIYTSAPFTFSTNTWYNVEMRVTVGSSTGALQGWLNGELLINAVNINTGANNIGRVEAGCAYSWAADNLYFDGVTIADS